MHTPFGVYESVEQALTGDKKCSKMMLNLNGIWQCIVYNDPGQVPVGWENGPQGAIREIHVPACWEFEGIGFPVYTNMLYPFNRESGDHSYETELTKGVYELNAPHIPKDNLTVCYYRKFDLPSSFEDKNVFLNFGGVETAYELAVNGHYIGFSEDSKLDSEFEITKYLCPGENLIAAKVMRFSPQSYLEDQDYWHVHGIYRDVTLYAKNRLRMVDYQVQTLFGDSLDQAKLRVRVWPDSNTPLYGEGKVKISLYDSNRKLILSKESKPFAEYGFYLMAKYVMEEEIPVERPMLWDSEHPNLYTLVLELSDGDGNVTDIESCRIGFREVRIENGILQLNRKRMIIRGTNLHEWSPYTGRAVPEEELRKTICSMKALNFNAIRTSHYPKNTMFYDICDEYGMYVVDEANVETHGYGGALSDSPLWLDAYLQRVVRMCLRDKNHPCVIIWSLGNESGVGANHSAMYGWLKEYDNRPVQYESGGGKPNTSDLLCPMYADQDWIENCMSGDDKRPMVLCEYIYAKSNSNGNMDLYWDLVRKYPRFQGGFLWDYQDKAIEQTKENGSKWMRYAGAFSEDVVDPVPDMCLNGIVFADLEPKPAAWELQSLQSPVQIIYWSWHGILGSYYIVNEQTSSDCGDMLFRWELVCNGERVQEGVWENIRIAPGERMAIELPYDRALVKGEAFFNVYVSLKEDTFYAKAGHVFYRIQLEAEGSRAYCPAQLPFGEGALGVMESSDQIFVEGGKIRVVIDRKTGTIAEASKAGETILNGERDLFYRAPTGIDEGQGAGSYRQQWDEAGLQDAKPIVKDIRVLNAESVVVVKIKTEFLDGKLSLDKSYEISEAGISLTVNVCNGTGLETLPRIGQGFHLPPRFERIKYYGRGPWENYRDRKKMSLVGLYETTVSEMHVPYVRCCECGGREDVRFLELNDGKGNGIRVTGGAYFHFSALPWSVDEYTQANYQDELPNSSGTFLAVDAIHAGLGGDTGWTRNIHPEYRILPGRYLYRIDLEWI